MLSLLAACVGLLLWFAKRMDHYGENLALNLGTDIVGVVITVFAIGPLISRAEEGRVRAHTRLDYEWFSAQAHGSTSNVTVLDTFSNLFGPWYSPRPIDAPVEATDGRREFTRRFVLVDGCLYAAGHDLVSYLARCCLNQLSAYSADLDVSGPHESIVVDCGSDLRELLRQHVTEKYDRRRPHSPDCGHGPGHGIEARHFMTIDEAILRAEARATLGDWLLKALTVAAYLAVPSLICLALLAVHSTAYVPLAAPIVGAAAALLLVAHRPWRHATQRCKARREARSSL
ncbi:hypothetical protein [Streptomyces sp. NPDC050528]|uniref:hypothetical protein n=1 Tax=Streptomyces sp. NPDC050528 TaxID=3365623 RepID=UPI0037A3AFD5